MPNGQDGFSFISILISLVIVGILASTALVHYRPFGLYSTDRTSSDSFVRRLDKNLATESLKKLHTMQITYHMRHHRYATFDDLLQEGHIAAGYTAKLGQHGVPYLEYWDIEINALEDSYLLLAVPNDDASDFEDVPILMMNESGNVVEEEGLVETEDESGDDIDDEIPFPFGMPE